MEKLVFEKREVLGKKNKHLLADGYVPSVVYNAKGDSTNIKLTTTIASQIAREATSTTILDAELDKKQMKVVVKEIDLNPLTGIIRHISFFEIDESKEMIFTIPFKIIGIAPAVKNNLGILVEVLSSIDVKCKLSDLVPLIEVDITKLEHPGQSISVDEINIPKNVEIVNEELEHATIVTVTEILEEEVFETPEVEEEDGVEGEEGEDATEGESPEDGAEEKSQE